jgi:organic hydroperoxide reductase OsmC/OhrA
MRSERRGRKSAYAKITVEDHLMAGDQDVHLFTASAVWSGDGMGCGTLKLPQGDISLAIGGSKALGGCGIGANPEELMLGAIAACFINTWAIFLKKLNLGYAEPALRVSGNLGPDPAGGFKLRDATIHARVPAPLMASHKTQVEKTLSLAEKYCIISKVAKAAMPVSVVIEEV